LDLRLVSRPACVKLVKNSQQNIIVKGAYGGLNLLDMNFEKKQHNQLYSHQGIGLEPLK
jgi:hypothetical protein